MFSSVCNLRILGVFPIPQRSHYVLGQCLMKKLAEAGHNVTIIAPYRNQDPEVKNVSYTEIVLNGIDESAQKSKCIYRVLFFFIRRYK